MVARPLPETTDGGRRGACDNRRMPVAAPTGRSSDGRNGGVPVSRAFSGGKRQREATRDRQKKEKAQRLARNRALRAQGIDPMLEAAPEALPEVKLEDVVISVPSRARRNAFPMKLFVGGLGSDVAVDTLRSAFERFGPIEDAVVILDRATGRSRGFGFVTFSNAADAQEAIKQMNGAQLQNGTLTVNNADSR
jgi:RNA recognition motif-containing protein